MRSRRRRRASADDPIDDDDGDDNDDDDDDDTSEMSSTKHTSGTGRYPLTSGTTSHTNASSVLPLSALHRTDERPAMSHNIGSRTTTWTNRSDAPLSIVSAVERRTTTLTGTATPTCVAAGALTATR